MQSYSQQLKGKVYADKNSNGKLDVNENVLANVCISDGFKVVMTNRKGDFEITPNKQAKFLFVRTPSGFKNLKKHFKILKNENDNYDFPLIKDNTQQMDDFRFVQITDTETAESGAWLDDLKHYCKNNPISFLLHTGDLCYKKGMEFHAKQMNSEVFGVPVYNTVGNHDLVEGETGETYFEELFGPVYYSFEVGNAHIVVTPMPSGDYQPSYNLDQIIHWLRLDLASKDPNKPLIFINHNYWDTGEFILKGKTDSIDLKAYNLVSWHYGHWHNNFSFKKGKVKIISTGPVNMGGIDNSVGQFLDIHVDKSGIKKIFPGYPNLNNHLQFLPEYFANTAHLNKYFELNFVAYDSKRNIDSIVVQAFNHSNQVLTSKKLLKKSPWHYSYPAFSTIEWPNVKGLKAKIHYNTQETYSKEFSIESIDSHVIIKPYWSTFLPGNIWKSSTRIKGDKLYIGTTDDIGTGKHGLYAINKKNGEIIWKVNTKNSIKNNVQLSDSLLIASDAETNIYALNSGNGERVWSKEVGKVVLPSYNTGSVLAYGMYFSRFGNILEAFEVGNGKRIWKSSFPVNGEATPASMEISEGILIFPTNWNSLKAIDSKTGSILWERKDDGLNFWSSSTSVEDEIVYCANQTSIFKLNLKTGETLQKSSFDVDFKVMAKPLILEDMILFSTSNQGVIAVNKHTLEKIWTFKTGEALLYSSPYSTFKPNKQVLTVENSIINYLDKLIITASDGNIYLLNRKGDLIQKYNLGVPIYADPVIDGNKLFVADYMGRISCFKLFDPANKRTNN